MKLWPAQSTLEPHSGSEHAAEENARASLGVLRDPEGMAHRRLGGMCSPVQNRLSCIQTHETLSLSRETCFPKS